MFTNPGGRAGRKAFSLTNWTEALSSTAPNVSVPIASFSVKSTILGVIYTNVAAAVVPFGTAGFMTSIPDGTAVGGNARGQWSTDTQLRRTTNTMVAATDYGALIAGRNNTLSNVSANTLLYAGIFCGIGNTISSSSGTVGTGHVLLGGNGNSIADSGGSNAAGIIGGQTIAITVAANKSGQFAGGGLNHTLSGNFASVVGGRNCDAVADNGMAFGAYARTRACESSSAHGCNGASASIGATQKGEYVLGIQTTNATPTVITATGGAASALNQVGPLPSGSAFAFKGVVVANNSGANAGMWEITFGLISNSAGTVAMVGAGATVTAGPISAALAGATVAVTADNANKCLQITVTGIAATTIGWTAFIETAEHT